MLSLLAKAGQQQAGQLLPALHTAARQFSSGQTVTGAKDERTAVCQQQFRAWQTWYGIASGLGLPTPPAGPAVRY